MRFACPGCRAVLGAPDRKTGRSALCPRCGLAVTVPSPATVPPLPEDDEPTLILPPEAPWWRWKAVAAGVGALLLLVGIWLAWPASRRADGTHPAASHGHAGSPIMIGTVPGVEGQEQSAVSEYLRVRVE